MELVSEKRFTLRLSTSLMNQVEYWAGKDDISLAEFVRNCVVESIERKQGDFDVPNLALMRLNQLIDVVEGLRVEQSNSQLMLSSTLSSITRLVEGEDYFSLTVGGDGDE